MLCKDTTLLRVVNSGLLPLSLGQNTLLHELKEWHKHRETH